MEKPPKQVIPERFFRRISPGSVTVEKFVRFKALPDIFREKFLLFRDILTFIRATHKYLTNVDFII